MKISESLYSEIRALIETARESIVKSVNWAMVITHWEIGRRIVEEEQNGQERAIYGNFLIVNLSKQLTDEFGKGFDARELRKMRQFYLTFPIRDALRPELSWTHYRLLLRVEDSKARTFYLTESIYAVEALIERVKNSNKNGYIWHTTGSGKTLSSNDPRNKRNKDLEKLLKERNLK